jgi:hypothetical protein
VGAEWLTVAESVVDSKRGLAEIVDGMIPGELPYLRVGSDPMEWFIERDQLRTRLARNRA